MNNVIFGAGARELISLVLGLKLRLNNSLLLGIVYHLCIQLNSGVKALYSLLPTRMRALVRFAFHRDRLILGAIIALQFCLLQVLLILISVILSLGFVALLKALGALCVHFVLI